jgi:hypothetical protein
MPFGGKDTLSVLSALASRMPPAPHTVISSIPRSFSDLVMLLLAKDKAKRIQTAREVSAAIQKIEDAEAKAASGVAASPAKEKIPVAKVLPTDAPARAPKENIPMARVLTDAASATNGLREKESDSDIRRKRARGRPVSRKRKSNKSEPDLARMVLFTSLALLGVAVLVLVIGIVTKVDTGSGQPTADVPRTGPKILQSELERKRLEEFRMHPIQMGQSRNQAPAALPNASGANITPNALKKRPDGDDSQ